MPLIRKYGMRVCFYYLMSWTSSLALDFVDGLSDFAECNNGRTFPAQDLGYVHSTGSITQPLAALLPLVFALGFGGLLL